ncbi:sensor domain-containing diguanylate cyclase [Sporosarcina cyprini]|uniref:sensor domain-containing diguanylate cyclase n=1 Tax=Sporosarcina cyprini TaxID=2910523 RepID=UPI001EDF8E5E|nr:sensor domain-containing diguanylate cyclase [Sporosarcina cyprini]MCG3087955.1 sensor domain-containing diguanylate cyclase [Sporosarcina cyprini]
MAFISNQDLNSIDLLHQILDESFLVLSLSPNGEIIDANALFRSFLQYELEEIYLKGYNKLINDGPNWAELREMLAKEKRWQGESCLVTKRGDLKWVKSTFILLNEGKEDAKILSFHLDCTEQKRAEEYRRLAFQNELTGLPNRRELLLSLERHVFEAEQNGSHFVVMFIDINRFKSVNDSYGHHVGDALLIEVGKRLAKLPYELELYHLSGDEFIILMDDNSSLDDVIASITLAFHDGFTVDTFCVKVSASIGISLYPENSRDPARLLQLADQAMFEAKAGEFTRWSFAGFPFVG